jgi:hypothetical protein
MGIQFPHQTASTMQEAGTDTSPLAPLLAHRRVLGVVGLLYCPAVSDIAKAYAAFESQCRQEAVPEPSCMQLPVHSCHCVLYVY